ncbi:hypothetical protein C900_01094 [Fulvivirga imtechensis AK7]|uniref:Uncharacterized protein n=1 Tax=Fulvivirga imtechensis AK7 TaxID=1237149 RepID=L8JVA6_9BACT|nr:hypothetical protein [Fulvivirga imtechensis]ELR72715.1 hypothetical protein C900_01094 [Fulvivirga imtechensis AK7]
MKSTMRILYIIILLVTISSCQSQPTAKYANKLDGCLNLNDIELLNSLADKFESHIKETYELSSTESYKRYLKDLSTGDLPKNFFRYPAFKQDMNRFRNSEFYKRTWVKTSNFDEESIIEVPPTVVNGKVRQQEAYDPIVIDPAGKYVNCLSKSIESKAMNDYMDVVKAGIDISPGLVAQALYENLSEEELDNSLTRLIIAINFHYQIGLMITYENKRIIK